MRQHLNHGVHEKRPASQLTLMAARLLSERGEHEMESVDEGRDSLSLRTPIV